MILSILLIIVVLLGVLLYIKAESIRCIRMINKLPSPKRIFLFEHASYLINFDEEKFYQLLRKWAKEFGPVYALSVFNAWGCVNITAPEEFELVASTMKNIGKSEIYELLHRWLGDGLLTSTGKKWQTSRKILTPAFHFSILQKFVQVFNEETEELVTVLKETNGESVNVMPLMSQLTLSTMAETSMGTKLERENDEHRKYVKATYKIGQVVYKRLMSPWCYCHLIYYNIIPQGFFELRLLKTIHNFCNKIIKNRAENFVEMSPIDISERKKLAMLDLLLQAQKKDGIIDEKGIQDEVNTFMFEGHDTTAISLSYTLMLLAVHQDIQEQVLQEIHQVIDGTQKYPSINELNDLKLMERVIKESLRLYPSVPFISRTLEEDITTKDGYLLPKGVNCNVFIIDIHMNEKYWPNPEKFDPDRFLPENCLDRHPFAYVPFSAGPRNCIGQKFAVLESKAVLCGILRKFKVEPVHTPETVVLVQNVLLKPKNENLKLKFTAR